MKNKTILYAAFDALLTLLYIVLVASFMSHMESYFSGTNELLIASVMLTLLVVSFALVGTFIFGRPIIWYLNGEKKEAIHLLGWTLGILFLILVIFIAVLLPMGHPAQRYVY